MVVEANDSQVQIRIKPYSILCTWHIKVVTFHILSSSSSRANYAKYKTIKAEATTLTASNALLTRTKARRPPAAAAAAAAMAVVVVAVPVTAEMELAMAVAVAVIASGKSKAQ